MVHSANIFVLIFDDIHANMLHVYILWIYIHNTLLESYDVELPAKVALYITDFDFLGPFPSYVHVLFLALVITTSVTSNLPQTPT